jgi:hypothetical protein
VLVRASACLLLLACACRPAAPKTPVETYLAFLNDLKTGDAAAAYALLSTPTRTALQARADAVSQASGATAKADPAGMIFQAPPPPPSEVKLVQQSGEDALLQVKGTQGDGQVRLVKETAGWRIDLTSTLR